MSFRSLELRAKMRGIETKTEDGYDKHIVCEGSREHVTWLSGKGIRCTHKNCVVNRDHCLTYGNYIILRDEENEQERFFDAQPNRISKIRKSKFLNV